MKSLTFVLIMFSFLSNSWSADASLSTFCKDLDKTLRQMNGSAKTCTPGALASLAGRPITYKGNKTSLLTPDEVQKLFKDMQSREDLAFGFKLDGCQARAQEMSSLMVRQGIKPMMGFLWVPDSEKKPDRLYYTDPKSGKEYVWTNHQAPLVMVEVNGKKVPYVIDPGTQSKAVSLEEWKKTFTRKNKKSKFTIDLGPTGQYAPGSPYMIPYDDVNTTAARHNVLKHLKSLENQADGEDTYSGEKLMELDDYQGKLDAMSGDN